MFGRTVVGIVEGTLHPPAFVRQARGQIGWDQPRAEWMLSHTPKPIIGPLPGPELNTTHEAGLESPTAIIAGLRKENATLKIENAIVARQREEIAALKAEIAALRAAASLPTR